MSGTDAQRTREEFERLVELPAAERASPLEALAAESADLAARVKKLLDAHDRAEKLGSILDPGGRPTALPETIGPYRLLDRIGEGGMGVVYLAEQKLPVRRRVAIKVIQPGMASPTVIRRFEAERQALAMMNHPGIAGILDGGETEDGLPYFVMEYVQGTPLLRYCDSHRLDIRQRLQLLRRIALAVQHAHQKGVIHRDLKPTNILVTEGDGEAQPKIIDFGIAKALFQPLTSSTLHTRSGAILGTPEYMSPEQCASSNVDVDTRSDVYALGALMYHMLTGTTAHDFNGTGISDMEIMQRLTEEDPPPPSRRALEMDETALHDRGFAGTQAIHRTLRGELDWITMRAMARDRNRRYESAQALADDIENYLNDTPVNAGPPSMPYQLGKFVRRHTLAATVIAMTFLFLGSSSLLMYWQVQKTKAERDRANREASIAREVTGFTAGLFELASPRESGARDVSALELLDLGVRRLELRLDDTTPLVRAALLQAAGTAYLDIGSEEEAERLLKDALSIYTDSSLENTEGLIRSYTTLASLEITRGKWEAAIEYSRRAHEIATTSSDVSTATLLHTVERHAEALRRSGDAPAAEELLQPYLSFADQHPSAPSLEMGRIYSAYGKTQESLAQYESAQRYLEKAVRIFDSTLHAGSYESNVTRDRLATVLMRQDRAEDAARILEEGLDSMIRLYGMDHQDVSALLGNLGLILVEIPERWDEAAAALEQSVVIDERLGIANRPDRLIGRSNLALLYSRMGEFEKAETIFREVISLREESSGADHVMTALARSGLASVHISQGKTKEAAPLLDAALPVYTKQFGERDWRTASLHYMKGRMYQEMGALNDAEVALALAEGIFLETLGAEHSRTEATQARLVEVRQAVSGKRLGSSIQND